MNEQSKIPRFDNNLVNITLVINLARYEEGRRREYLAAKHPHRLEPSVFDEPETSAYDHNAYEMLHELTEEQNKLLKSGNLLSPYAMAIDENKKVLFELLDTLRGKPPGATTYTGPLGIPAGKEFGADVIDTRLPQMVRFTWMGEFGQVRSVLWRHPYGLDLECHSLASFDDLERMRVLRHHEDVDDLGQELAIPHP